MSDLEAKIRNSGLTPFEQLLMLMEILRSEQGCNWDRAQTHLTLLPYLLEETYEVIQTIEDGRLDDLASELGDLLIQVVFHAQIASERGDFDINDSIRILLDKMITRHPHVFSEHKNLAPDQVRDQWETIKTVTETRPSILGGVPRNLPALTMAFRIGEKAAGVGFDWHTAQGALDKVREEISELTTEINSDQPDNSEQIKSEIGDLLFAVASLSRKLDIEPESALRGALTKFKTRFALLELKVREDDGRFEDFNLEQLEEFWQAVKNEPPPDNTD